MILDNAEVKSKTWMTAAPDEALEAAAAACGRDAADSRPRRGRKTRMPKVEIRKPLRKRPDDRSEIAANDLEEDGASIAPSRQGAVPLESAHSTYCDVDDFAREMLKTKRGIGMTPPFKLKTGHDWALQSGPAPDEIAR